MAVAVDRTEGPEMDGTRREAACHVSTGEATYPTPASGAHAHTVGHRYASLPASDVKMSRSYLYTCVFVRTAARHVCTLCTVWWRLPSERILGCLHVGVF